MLILGYPLNFGHFGGLVWIKRVRVTDYIEKNNLLSVRKVQLCNQLYNLYTSSSEASPLLFDSKSRNSFIVFLLIQNITYLVSI